MAEILQARVEQKIDTEANWLANPLILLSGEQAFVLGTDGVTPVNFKIGDGTKKFSDLPYWINYAGNIVVSSTAPGGTLPAPASAGKIMILAPGTYTQPTGGGTITAANNTFTVAYWGGSAWSIMVAVALNGDIPRLDKTDIFSATSGPIDTYLLDFLLDLKLTGLVIAPTDTLHVFWVFRNYLNGASNANSFAIGLNGVRITSWVAQTYVEPAADAKGRILDTLVLVPIGGSGVSGKAYVDWNAFPTGTRQDYGTTLLGAKSRISQKVYNKTLVNPTVEAKIINLTPTGNLPSLNVSRGSSTVDAELSRIDKNRLFQGSEIDSQLINFLIDLQLTGLTVNNTDQVHIFYAWRNYPNPTTPQWTFAVGLNGVRIASATILAEPAADASGRRISILTLTPSAGAPAGNTAVNGTAIVDWSALTDGTALTYSSTRIKSLLSPNIYNNKIPPIIAVTAAGVTRGTSTVDAEFNRIDKNKLFRGSEIEPYLLNFLLDIQISGMTVSNTDVVHLYFVYRNYPNPTTPQWTVAIGINGSRVAQFSATGYVEPTADASGRKIATIVLSSIGSVPNNTAVTATAIVDWAAAADGVAKSYITSNNNQAQLSQNVYNSKIPVVPDLSSVKASIARIENNNIFSGDSIDTKLLAGIVDLKITGQISISSTQTVHVYYVYRNFTQSVGVQRWLVAIAIDETRICQYLLDNWTEPAADAQGNIFQTITLPAFGSSGITAQLTINWAAFTSGVSLAYNGTANTPTSANYLKSKISPNAFLHTLGGSSAASKLSLPATTVPNNIYTVLNDIDPQNLVATANPNPAIVRNYSQRLYVDRFLLGFGFDTDVRFDLTGTDKYPLASPRANDDDIVGYDHPTPSTTIAKAVIINGGSGYNNRTVNFNQISTRESVGASTLVGLLAIGDSTIQGLNTEIGVPPGYSHRSYGVIHEQFLKSKIDYLFAAGYSQSDIQAYIGSGTVGPITSGDQAKYNFFSMGLSPAGSVPDTYTLNYRGVTKNCAVQAEGRGGWGLYTYINKPRACTRAQGSWDLIGLGDGSGTDYTGSAAQMKLFDRTAWNPAGLKDTAAMRAYVTANYFFTGTDTASYITWATQQGTAMDDMTIANSAFYNAFYDAANTTTVTDSAGDVWQIRFSIKKYLARYRTMTDAGVRLASGYGSKITDPSLYDIFKPTHIILQSCQNDGNIAHFGLLAKALADSIKAEYTANSYGTVNIGISIVDGAGTYFPKLYPEVDAFCKMDEFQRGVHNDNLGRLLTAITSETANRVFVICNTHISPTAKSIVYRGANSPEYELSGLEKDTYRVASRSSIGIKAHQNAFGHRCWGIQDYAWIKYTLGL